jgi:hypothetical protein
MNLPFFGYLQPRRQLNVELAVDLECDKLIEDWGDGASERATYLAWEEVAGTVWSPSPGHWWRVRCEIDRRHDHATAKSQFRLQSSENSNDCAASI